MYGNQFSSYAPHLSSIDPRFTGGQAAQAHAQAQAQAQAAQAAQAVQAAQAAQAAQAQAQAAQAVQAAQAAQVAQAQAQAHEFLAQQGINPGFPYPQNQVPQAPYYSQQPQTQPPQAQPAFPNPSQFTGVYPPQPAPVNPTTFPYQYPTYTPPKPTLIDPTIKADSHRLKSIDTALESTHLLLAQAISTRRELTSFQKLSTSSSHPYSDPTASYQTLDSALTSFEKRHGSLLIHRIDDWSSAFTDNGRTCAMKARLTPPFQSQFEAKISQVIKVLHGIKKQIHRSTSAEHHPRGYANPPNFGEYRGRRLVDNPELWTCLAEAVLNLQQLGEVVEFLNVMRRAEVEGLERMPKGLMEVLEGGRGM